MAEMNQKLRIETEPSDGYILSGKIMLGAVVILAVMVVFALGFNIYTRWYLVWARRQLERRRQRRGHRIHNVLYADNRRRPQDRGLERAVLSSLPVFLYSAKSLSAEEPPLDCAVCLSDFERNDIVRLLPKCNHSFHIDCIDMWFHSHSTCPICRSLVEPVFKPVVNLDEPDFTMVFGLPATCQIEERSRNINTTSSGDGRKGVELLGLRIEARQPRRVELEDELTQISPASQGFRSPGTRLLSLKRILSMNRKYAVGGGAASTSRGHGAVDVDLESGGLNELTREPSHEHTPISINFT